MSVFSPDISESKGCVELMQRENEIQKKGDKGREEREKEREKGREESKKEGEIGIKEINRRE